jgi:Flp pilus assembly protein TadD
VLLEEVRRLADTGQYHAALDAIEDHDGGTSVSGRLWKGILRLNLGDSDAAVSLFRQCVFLRPEEPDLRRWLAVAYEAVGKIKEAEREHRNAAEMGS